MLKVTPFGLIRTGKLWLTLLVPIVCVFLITDAGAFNLNVVGSDGMPVREYRWMVEEDNTNITVPGRQVPDAFGNTSISIDIHNSYAPVLASGHKSNSDPSPVSIPLPSNKPYFITVMPDGDPVTGNPPRYALSGTTVSVAQDNVTVTVNEMPIPTAQIYLIAFVDHNPISNAKDEREDGLGGVSIYLFDFSGGGSRPMASAIRSAPAISPTRGATPSSRPTGRSCSSSATAPLRPSARTTLTPGIPTAIPIISNSARP